LPTRSTNFRNREFLNGDSRTGSPRPPSSLAAAALLRCSRTTSTITPVNMIKTNTITPIRISGLRGPAPAFCIHSLSIETPA